MFTNEAPQHTTTAEISCTPEEDEPRGPPPMPIPRFDFRQTGTEASQFVFTPDQDSAFKAEDISSSGSETSYIYSFLLVRFLAVVLFLTTKAFRSSFAFFIHLGHGEQKTPQRVSL